MTFLAQIYLPMTKTALLREHLDQNSLKGGDLFTELKKLRKCQPIVASSIDGVTDQVADYFCDIYKGLYNSANDMDDLLKICKQTEAEVDYTQAQFIRKITPDLLK